MGVLRIQLFGTVRVSHDGPPHDTRLIHAVQSLLAWLVLHRRRTYARETLAGLFWGEHTEGRARSCLSTALWRLRRVLEPSGITRGTYLIAQNSGEIGFNCDSEHWLDVAEFEEGVQRHLPEYSVAGRARDWSGAEAAVSHYTGDLLEGFYEEWALRERERLRILYLDSLGTLLKHYSETGALQQALRCARQILALDPLREEVHREVIRLHLRSGHRALALQQYESCRALLDEELGIEPMEETRALHVELMKSGVGRHDVALPRLAPTALKSERVVPSLRAAAEKLDEARDAVAHALRAAESDQV
jgi:DNA-binding SARP family transcriptional activator